MNDSKPDTTPGILRCHLPLSGDTTMKDTMYNDSKASFQDFVSQQMLVSADWRSRQLQRFPEDARNEKARVRLLKLESEIDISDDKWERLEPLVQDNKFLTAISETNRAVGFRTYPADFSAWLANLHSNLTRH
jgi:hypothetical protein